MLPMRFPTKAIHAGQQPDPSTGAIMPPVYLTSTYVQSAPGEHLGYEYSRSGNPTRTALERSIAELEGGKHGMCFASGLAAENTILHLLQSGDHIVSARDVYGGTFRLFDQVWRQLGLDITFINAHNLDEVTGAIRDNTKFLWIESPSNPLLTVTDIAAAAEIAHAKNVQVVVDNTFATPCLQRPLEYGADLIVHSTTKYLGGHSDVIGGAIVTDNDELDEKLRYLQNALGGVPGPLDCFLVLRGIKTLAVRMQRHCENAIRVAQFLEQHDDVEYIYYPGLADDPAHEVASRQMCAYGGMVSLELTGGVDRNLRFIKSTQLFALAESLGGVESMINHPASMTHASIPREEREKGGLRDSLSRLSVGIEDVNDLIDDLDRAISESKS